MKKITGLLIFLFAGSANATVVLNDLEITDTSLSFHVTGTISSMANSYHQQLLFGLVDDATSDWITSFNSGSSSWVEGTGNTVATDYVYDLSGSYSDSLLTVSSTNWQLGDEVDIIFNFVGQFNVAEFDVNNFGMQAGYTSGSIVSSTYNLVTSSVPEPSTIALLGLGLAGIGFSRRKKTS